MDRPQNADLVFGPAECNPILSRHKKLYRKAAPTLKESIKESIHRETSANRLRANILNPADTFTDEIDAK
jgi:hypothetical protein